MWTHRVKVNFTSEWRLIENVEEDDKDEEDDDDDDDDDNGDERRYTSRVFI